MFIGQSLSHGGPMASEPSTPVLRSHEEIQKRLDWFVRLEHDFGKAALMAFEAGPGGAVRPDAYHLNVRPWRKACKEYKVALMQAGFKPLIEPALFPGRQPLKPGVYQILYEE